jgi:hypothetical protein
VDVTGNQPAALDLDLAVVDRSRDAPARLDQKPLLHDEIAFEAAAHFGSLDRGGALEQAGFGDTEIAAIRQVGLDAALDDILSQDVISSRQNDLTTDNQLPDDGYAAPRLKARVAGPARRSKTVNPAVDPDDDVLPLSFHRIPVLQAGAKYRAQTNPIVALRPHVRQPSPRPKPSLTSEERGNVATHGESIPGLRRRPKRSTPLLPYDPVNIGSRHGCCRHHRLFPTPRYTNHMMDLRNAGFSASFEKRVGGKWVIQPLPTV